jgi:hypothetical protein
VDGVEDVRLIRVDTPETYGGQEPLGSQASAYARGTHYAGGVCSQLLSQLGCSRFCRYGLARLAFRLIYEYIPFVAAPIVLLFLPIAVEFGHVFGKVIGRSATLIGDRPIGAILMNTGSRRGFTPVSA